MSRPRMLVGFVPAQQSWSVQLRTFIRDHVAGMDAETVFDARQLARSGQRPFDVVIVDDTTKIFNPSQIGAAVAAGTVVIGVFDAQRGMGRAYLEQLGVSRLVEVSTPAEQLAAIIAEIGPVNGEEPIPHHRGDPNGLSTSGSSRNGALVVCSAAAGGTGLTEAVIAIAETWATQGLRTLVVEANPIAAILAARLRRPTGFGLAWALGAAGEGHPILPGGLTPDHTELGPGLGRFDVVCQTSAPGGPPVVATGHLALLVDEALAAYDKVLVDTGPLIAASAGQFSDRFAPARAVLVRADEVVGFAQADPDGGVVQLAEWRAAVRALGATGSCWAVFGRFPRGEFERFHLINALYDSTGEGEGRFAWAVTLPEDPIVARARWNGEMVWRGAWLATVQRLASQLSRAPASRPAPAVMPGQSAPSPTWATQPAS